ncbi:hypothetical protein A1O1_06308 [Capronia coronata CBS 617.96]|uniref:ADA HAT complex component 1 n=1 Tax=Capronia coronata CBS 617.96 TaxID=1182541 RepID=W9YUI2_9EURO|nr:uncharacterized protein A1O1_06308 [Capronia coronata CBS 617.96]EXJ85939.1 hypothetical protein A1O1_06308 [Capronia coronata CBS 617.96]
MVRKNETSAVLTQTKLAWEKLSTHQTGTAPSTSTVTAALDVVCELKGIGPATGTLILNVYDSDHVPFFQDEMFMWFFPHTKGDKLKYTQKEYLQLFDSARPVLEKLGIKAIELEKISYVLGHLELLEPNERSKLEHDLRLSETETKDEEVKQEVTLEDKKVKTHQPQKQTNTTQVAKRTSSTLEIDKKEQQPPKRRSQRIK